MTRLQRATAWKAHQGRCGICASEIDPFTGFKCLHTEENEDILVPVCKECGRHAYQIHHFEQLEERLRRKFKKAAAFITYYGGAFEDEA